MENFIFTACHDKVCDVLNITLYGNQNSIPAEDSNNGIVIYRDKETGEITGLRIFGITRLVEPINITVECNCHKQNTETEDLIDSISFSSIFDNAFKEIISTMLNNYEENDDEDTHKYYDTEGN